VKVKNNNNSNVAVKEILINQQGTQKIKKINFNRILNYSTAVWHLYRYERKSKKVRNDNDIGEQKRHKSVLFLSKAGRYFTVGASGLLVNYLVSFLLANVCQSKLSVNLLLLLEVELFHSRLAETGRCFCYIIYYDFNPSILCASYKIDTNFYSPCH
jgi:hypothetical protein